MIRSLAASPWLARPRSPAWRMVSTKGWRACRMSAKSRRACSVCRRWSSSFMTRPFLATTSSSRRLSSAICAGSVISARLRTTRADALALSLSDCSRARLPMRSSANTRSCSPWSRNFIQPKAATHTQTTITAKKPMPSMVPNFIRLRKPTSLSLEPPTQTGQTAGTEETHSGTNLTI